MAKSVMYRTFEQLKSLFFNGLFTLLPLTVTIALFNFSYKLVKSWLMPLYKREPQFLQEIPHSEVLLVLVFILLVGLISRFFLLNRIWNLFESLVERVPLLRPVYFGVKQLIEAFTAKDKGTFQKIVLIEFPRPGVYSLGFLTSAIPAEIAPSKETTYYSVFIPATPNPTTGFYVVVPEKECAVVDLTKQEAMSLIISGGIIQPERFKKTSEVS